MSLQENGNYEGWKQQFSIKLNEQQERAVRTAEGSVLLLAVPGSGKTTVLVARLGYLIFCRGILPENILTITYTVAATRDMKRRFGETFGEAMGEGLEFRTINGISQKILQYFAGKMGKTVYADMGLPTSVAIVTVEYLRSQIVTANISSKTRSNPYVFTEQGVYMLMTVLKGELAVRQSIALVRTFKRMKDYILENRD